MTYAEKLLDPRWQKKRLEIFSRDNWTCLSCGRLDMTLSVHHRQYIDGRDPWDYPDHMLATYCKNCHETEHLIGSTLREDLISILRIENLYIRQVSELCILIENHHPFYENLKQFLTNQMTNYLKSKTECRTECLGTGQILTR